MIPINIKTNISYDRAAMYLLIHYREKTVSIMKSWTHEQFKDILTDVVFKYGMQCIHLFNYFYADLEHLIPEVKSMIYKIENKV